MLNSTSKLCGCKMRAPPCLLSDWVIMISYTQWKMENLINLDRTDLFSFRDRVWRISQSSWRWLRVFANYIIWWIAPCPLLYPERALSRNRNKRVRIGRTPDSKFRFPISRKMYRSWIDIRAGALSDIRFFRTALNYKDDPLKQVFIDSSTHTN